MSAWGKVFSLCVIVGGTTFPFALLLLVRHGEQSLGSLNQLLNLVEKTAPDIFRSFFTGDMIHHKERFLKRRFREFLRSQQLDELPEIAEAKRSYLLRKQSDSRTLKCVTCSLCLIIVGIFGVFFCLARFGHP